MCLIKAMAMVIMLGIFFVWLLFMLGLAWFGFHIGFLVGIIPLVFLVLLLYSPIRRFYHNFPMYKVIFKEDFRKAQEDAKRKYSYK